MMLDQAQARNLHYKINPAHVIHRVNVIILALELEEAKSSRLPKEDIELADWNLASRQIGQHSCPKYIIERTAMNDLLNPTMENISRRSPNANPALALALHEQVQGIGIPAAPTQVNDNSLSMELGLRARNGLFAMKVSFVNAISSMAIKYNYPTNEVLQIAGLDPWILNFHLTPDIGFGGPNFKHDLDYLSYLAKQQGCQPQAQFFNQINVLNSIRMVEVATWIKEGMIAIRDRVIVVLGVSYKNGTGDIKEWYWGY
ncbi:hypothetical protein RHSIM_Rhsim12G0061800 [Rhododendron simsii]|uniref:UDP-glucose/GDP-mannose dehydrogenase dimerisation domain-containing protein n=1 Tax=Rhododendron simsii TaxID=118357 RepID=A0A834L8N6_RHOSS|nr:hypothetical protein RHSIM_Rhsim12G0061800 [Rhododendron simsii]